VAEVADRRRAIADRNVQAILDAAEELIRALAPVTIAGVATRRRRVPGYRVRALRDPPRRCFRRSFSRAVGACRQRAGAARPGEGPPVEAMERLVAMGWRELGKHAAMAEAAGTMLSAEAMARSHAAAHPAVAELVERGSGTGRSALTFPGPWLVTCCFALLHACADEVRAGRIEAGLGRVGARGDYQRPVHPQTGILAHCAH